MLWAAGRKRPQLLISTRSISHSRQGSLNKDPQKNAQAIERFAPIGRFLLPIAILAGALMVLSGLVTRS